MTAKNLFLEFVSRHIGATCTGLQQGFGDVPDQLLFEGPRHQQEGPLFGMRTTLAVDVALLMEPRETAQRVVRDKIRRAESARAT